jgi:cytochrome d ubiquinol oxidase subunit II
LLIHGAHRGARILAMAAVASVVVGWGVAQWPYMLPTSLKVSAAAAPDPTLATILVVFVVAAIVILPSLGLLYVLDQKNLVEADATTIDA